MMRRRPALLLRRLRHSDHARAPDERVHVQGRFEAVRRWLLARTDHRTRCPQRSVAGCRSICAIERTASQPNNQSGV